MTNVAPKIPNSVRRKLRLKKSLIAVFLTLTEWLNMNTMVPVQGSARVSVPYRFVSVYFEVHKRIPLDKMGQLQ